MAPAGFETAISAGERPQTYTLHRAAAGIGKMYMLRYIIYYYYIIISTLPLLKLCTIYHVL
jgi:hypothetical protein